MESHLNTIHFKRKPYDCAVCGRYFTSKENLESHLRVHKYGPKTKKMWKLFSCDWEGCHYKARYKRTVDIHISKEHIHERPYKCPHCEKTFFAERYLKDHVKHHWGPEKKFHCNQCSYSSPNSRNLGRHMARHSSERNFRCMAQECGKTFKSLYERNSHFKHMHVRGKIFVCDWPGCDKSFRFKAILDMHKSYHLNERKFKCDFEGCRRSLNNLTDLKSHKRRHINSYVCSWPACGQRFNAKSLLTTHTNVHQNIKAFVCEYPDCGKSYFHMSALYRHRNRNGHKLFNNRT